MKNRFIFGITLLLILSTYQIQDDFKITSIFNIKKILIENNNIVDERDIIKKISFIYETNLIFIKREKLQKKLNQIDFIESFEIKKVYPDKIKIKIFEKKPIAIIQNKKNKSFFTANGGTAKFSYIEKYTKLPIVFGDINSFKIFYNNLNSINFSIDEIDKFYLFESRRWDLKTIENQIIKLPVKDYKESLKNFLDIKNQVKFKKYKIFDYRIKDQLILK
tara:strand:- start:441 stop:1100 length:660 start_codon:yes stop_codon:yes gene_type:complete